MESIGLMGGGVAHDFKNFIHVIAANANAIKDSGGDPALLRRASQIVDVCRKASGIIDNMMNLARTDEHPKSRIDLNEEVGSSLDLLKVSMPEGILLETSLAADRPGIEGDATQVCRVVANLVNNAKEALGREGSVAIRTENAVLTEEDCLRHANARPGEFVVLTIADSGPGIPQNLLPRIYDPFFLPKVAMAIRDLAWPLCMPLFSVTGDGSMLKVRKEPARDSPSTFPWRKEGRQTIWNRTDVS
jgi:signal transduction histidine kinase